MTHSRKVDGSGDTGDGVHLGKDQAGERSSGVAASTG